MVRAFQAARERSGTAGEHVTHRQADAEERDCEIQRL
jgi:hypothetical protein